MILPGGPPKAYPEWSNPGQQQRGTDLRAEEGGISLDAVASTSNDEDGTVIPSACAVSKEILQVPVDSSHGSAHFSIGREGDPFIPCPLQSINENASLPLFRVKYGSSARRSDLNNDADPASRTRFFRVESVVGSSSNQDSFREIDSELQRAHLAHLEALEANPFQLSRSTGSSHETEPREQSSPSLGAVSQPPATNCLVCTEEFSETVLRIGSITEACQHLPSVCHDCLAQWIKSELDSKGCGKIECPECRCLLAYEDIRRLADSATFSRYIHIYPQVSCHRADLLSRYETLTLRNALSSDENFVWCRNCDFGQIHSGGASHPVVRCQACDFLSCFTHSIPWHHRLTCEEYDQMLEDPEGFRSALDREEHEAERTRLQQEEDDRQEARLRKERTQQEAEAAARRKELAERARQRKLQKQRLVEDALSMTTVRATTKQCPGRSCKLPIEKNEGCAHMTCKCIKTIYIVALSR